MNHKTSSSSKAEETTCFLCECFVNWSGRLRFGHCGHRKSRKAIQKVNRLFGCTKLVVRNEASLDDTELAGNRLRIRGAKSQTSKTMRLNGLFNSLSEFHFIG